MKNIKNSSDTKTDFMMTWAGMFLGVWRSRWLIRQLLYRDFTVRYRQSYFGYIWAVLPQLATVAIFAFLMRYRVFDMGETAMPYIIHALWSVSLWQLFSSTLINCTKCLVDAGALVTKINFPKESLVLAAMGQPLLDFLIRLVPMAIVMVWVGFVPSLQSIWTVIIIVFLMLLCLGCGFILAVINLVLRDVGNIIGMVLTFGMFFSPILYPPPVREPFIWVNILNPFSPFLISTQELLIGAEFSHPYLLVFMSIFAVVLFLFGWKVFCISMPRICERA